MTTSNKQWRKKITRLSIRSQSVLPGGGGGLNPLSRRWSNHNLHFDDNFSISAVRLHHTYLASVERNVPQLFSIFLISRSLYFYLIIVKIFIFVLLISRSLFYLIIVNVFIFVSLISRFLCFYPITIIISFFTYVYPKQLFNPFFTDHLNLLQPNVRRNSMTSLATGLGNAGLRNEKDEQRGFCCCCLWWW